jgi:hypothetical protein
VSEEETKEIKLAVKAEYLQNTKKIVSEEETKEIKLTVKAEYLQNAKKILSVVLILLRRLH